MPWLSIDKGDGSAKGIVAIAQVVAVGRSESAPIERLVAALPMESVIDLTAGSHRRSVLFLADGRIILTPLSVTEVEKELHRDT